LCNTKKMEVKNMTATLNDLKKEARKLYKRLERQALNTVNNREDIARYNHLMAKINGGEEHGSQSKL